MAWVSSNIASNSSTVSILVATKNTIALYLNFLMKADLKIFDLVIPLTTASLNIVSTSAHQLPELTYLYLDQ